MNTIYYLAGALVACASIIVGLLTAKRNSEKLGIFFKVMSLVLLAALFFRYMLGDDNIFNIKNLQVGYGFTSVGWIVLALVEVWLAYATEVLTIIASFYRSKIVSPLMLFLVLPVAVMNYAFMFNHQLAIVGETYATAFSVRGLLLAVETGLLLGYAVVYIVRYRDEIIPKGIQWWYFALAAFSMIAAAMPSYALQLLFNTNNIVYRPIDLNLYHRLCLYPIVVLPILMYFALKDKSEKTKMLALLYYSWIGLLNFSLHHRFGDFVGEGWVTALPLHLCNTAMYITPICLTFKWKKLFYFTYFINVLGAFLALLMPNYGEATIFSSRVLQFYANHYQAFFMPLLIVGLGIFRRPRWKEFKYSMIGFAVYFALMLIVNAWFTNYNPDVDYFFLNSDFIAEKFGSWGQGLRAYVWTFKIGKLSFTFYPLYQFLYFLVYFAAAFGMWFIYELAYNAVSGWLDIAARKKVIAADKLALEVSLGGRNLEEPIHMENSSKLVLTNLTKRYGKSDVYAVKDVNLEVNGGEIYGFLGPNGAGKSTIIKSIVGIQPISGGSIEVCGYDATTQSVQAKRQIGFVPDHYALYERLTAREYINYIADLYEVSQADRDERLARFIKLFEFEAAIDLPIKTYSHGMKQKVTIMSALIHNPKVWILDEPLTGLDPNSIYQVKECMKRHAEEGNIVFFSSHIIDVVERICDKIAIIRKGQIQCVRDVHQMEADGESLEEFYMNVINGHEVKPIAVNAREEAK